MTRKLNLSHLINHFGKKDKTVAKRLSGLTKKSSSGRLSASQLQKIAQTLIDIGDELDQTDPSLAVEADSLLQELVKEAECTWWDWGCKLRGGDAPAQKMMDNAGLGGNLEEHSMMGDGQKMMEKTDEPDMEDDVIEIEEIHDHEPEYDMVGLADIEDRLATMKFRISDKKSREDLEEAIEHIQKAMDYDKASKGRKGKVHDIFDNAGLQLRLKDFE